MKAKTKQNKNKLNNIQSSFILIEYNAFNVNTTFVVTSGDDHLDNILNSTPTIEQVLVRYSHRLLVAMVTLIFTMFSRAVVLSKAKLNSVNI